MTMLHPSSSPPRGGGGGGAAAVLGKNASRRRRDLFTAAAKTNKTKYFYGRGGRRLCDAVFARRSQKKNRLRRAKTFLATKEGRVFAEAFKARMMIFAASKKDEKKTKRPSSSSKSLFPSVVVKLWESLKGTNGAGGGGDDDEEKKKKKIKKNKNDEEDDDDDENFERILNSVFVSLLVTEGAIKGSAMTLLGLILHVKVIGSFQFVSGGGGGGVLSASDIGIACAMPLVLADFAIMNLVFPAAPSSLASAADISSPPSLTTAVSNYAKEASLNNPCVDMPFYKDATVAIVARVADSFACVFTLGFLFTWITERGVEYGYEVYEIEQTTKWMALAAAVLGKEAMIFYQNYRREGLGKGGDETEENKKRKPAMRAYVVTRDKITGKEKMEEITAENIKAKKKRGEKLEPQELAIESAMYNINVRSTIDDWRERVSTGMLGLSFVVSGGNGVAPLVGGLLGDLLFCVYQRNNVKKYLDMYGEDDEKSSDISNNNNSSSSSSSSSNKKNKTKKLRTSIALAKARQREMQKRQREMQNVLAKNVEKKEGKGKTSTDSGNSSKSNIITSSQKINDMIQTIQKEASLVARLVVEADAKESLLESNQTSSTPALTNAERKAYRNIEQKLPTLMTGLFEGDTPEFSEYEVAFKEAQKVLLTERHSLESKIQSFDEIIDNYRAMFALVFALEDDDEDEEEENGDDTKKKKKENDTGDDDDDFEKFANFL